MALIWVMQLARWPRSRVRTSVFTPSQVERNRVTSFMHSLKPARYLPSTVGSVLSAAAGGEAHSDQRAPQGIGVGIPPASCPAAPPSWESGQGGQRLWQRVLCSWVPGIPTKSTAPAPHREQVTRGPPCTPKYWGFRLAAQSPTPLAPAPPTPPDRPGGRSTALLAEGTPAGTTDLPVPWGTGDGDKRARPRRAGTQGQSAGPALPEDACRESGARGAPGAAPLPPGTHRSSGLAVGSAGA